jgi:hypothetical protein
LGPFDLPLPLSGPLGIEPRIGSGPNLDGHQVVVKFPTGVSVANATASPGAVTTFLASGNQVFVNFNAPNASRVTITLVGVNDSVNTANVVVPIGLLRGDVNQDGFVLSGDYTATRQKSGTAVDTNTFQFDVNTDGFILSGDYTVARQQSGTQLP